MEKNERIRLFVAEYLVDFNGVRAARAAGHQGKASSLAVTASRYLAAPEVQKLLKRAMEERIKKTGITAAQIVRELGRLGFSDITELCKWDEHGNLTIKPSARINRRIARAIKEISRTWTEDGPVLKIKLHDKVKPLELLGRHTGALDSKPNDDAEADGERVVVHLPDNGRGDREAD